MIDLLQYCYTLHVFSSLKHNPNLLSIHGRSQMYKYIDVVPSYPPILNLYHDFKI